MQTYFNNPYKSISEKYLAERFFELWLNSPGHRANMEDVDFTGFVFDVKTGLNEQYGQVIIGVQTLITE